jgi:tetratricopeptide (TPR) repeat protein
MARARGDKLTELRRAELEVLASAATNDAARRREALFRLSRLTPADADALRQLAQMDSGNQRYDSAAQFYQHAVELDPSDVVAWNQLGYTEALRRNLDGARTALEEYQRLAPKDPNASDSLGDVHFHLGAFREAEKYYLEAYRKDPKFAGGLDLYKAARARLMTGDVAGADENFRRYLDDRTAAQDSMAPFLRAQWVYLTGRKDAGREQMLKLASPAAGGLLSLVAAQLSAWSAQAGARQDAAQWAGKAAGAASTPAGRVLAAQCLVLAGQDVPRGVLTDEAEKRTSAIALLLARRFGEAVAPLQELAARGSPMAPDRTGVWLAWALVETGKPTEAAPLLATYGTPPAGFEDVFAGLGFPRLFQLRAAVLEQQGRRQEAAEMRGIHQKLGGR